MAAATTSFSSQYPTISCREPRRGPSTTESPSSLAGEFGALIRRLRYARGLSQEGLAEAAKLQRGYVGMIERGETNVSVRTAFRLARALGTDLAGMFAELEREPDH